MKQFQVLLAKRPQDSANPRHEETLVGHTQSVLEMAELMVDLLSPHLKDLLEVEGHDVLHWRRAATLAAWMHDWGKANDHFQTMVRDPKFKQGVRHETLSLLLCVELREWLKPAFRDLPEWAHSAALFAVSGHHLKFPDPWEESRNGTEATAFMGHQDFALLLRKGAEKFELSDPLELTDRTFSLLHRGEVKKALRSLQRELVGEFTEKEKTLIAATKAVLMAADLAGSALPLKMDDPSAWIGDRLRKGLKTDQLAQVVATKLKDRRPREFQIRVGQSKSRTTLVEAGCGSGKTAAAYLWAAQHADGKRLFFCYPTTGTASEGFAGYLRDPDFDAILLHGRAHVDYRLLENMPQPSHEENDLRQARLEALETWPIPAAVCTAHTVLGLMENVRRGIYAWPALVQSIFVFDEVHAFSDRLFSYLLRFLRAFPGARVLLMTATLPDSRRQALIVCCNTRGGLDIIGGPKKREQAKRYRLRRADITEAWSELKECLRHGGKVLWVCNTVRRAMTILDEAMETKLPVQPYHSRYRYKDRLQRHRTVIDGFASGKPAMVAVTTQVAEMSLDLSADLLITEWAPVPSMIQRLGRLNRFEETPSCICQGLFLEPESTLPYDAEAMEGVAEWLRLTADGDPKSQADLAAAFVGVVGEADNLIEPAVHCEWLDGLWRSLKDKRAIEEAGYTIEVVREEDLEEGTVTEMAVPMPKPPHADLSNWRRQGRYLVAPRGTVGYDEFRGAEWKQNHQ